MISLDAEDVKDNEDCKVGREGREEGVELLEGLDNKPTISLVEKDVVINITIELTPKYVQIRDRKAMSLWTAEECRPLDASTRPVK